VTTAGPNGPKEVKAAVDAAIVRLSQDHGIAIDRDDPVLLHTYLNTEILEISAGVARFHSMSVIHKMEEQHNQALSDWIAVHGREAGNAKKRERALLLFAYVAIACILILLGLVLAQLLIDR